MVAMRVKETNAERLRRLRADAIARGDCRVCRARKAKPGRRTCQHCLDLTKKNDAKNRYKKCLRCGQPWTKALLCPECTALNSDRTAQKRAEAIAAGRCSRCRQNPRLSNRRQCAECVEEIRIKRRHRLTGNPCAACGSLEHNSRFHTRGVPMTAENATTTYTLEEWHARARELFGDDSSGWKFVCPSCAHVASVGDWKAAGAPEGCVAFSCIGRWTLPPKKAEKAAFKGKGGPCNYAGGGLFGLNPITVIDPDGKKHQMFAFAEAA